jgi:hypothetical protein
VNAFFFSLSNPSSRARPWSLLSTRSRKIMFLGSSGLTTLSPSVSRLSRQCGILSISQPYRPPQLLSTIPDHCYETRKCTALITEARPFYLTLMTLPEGTIFITYVSTIQSRSMFWHAPANDFLPCGLPIGILWSLLPCSDRLRSPNCTILRLCNVLSLHCLTYIHMLS